MSMPTADTFDRVEVSSRAAFGDWLAKNHTRTQSVWLITHKKSEGRLYVPFDAIVEELLAWGWIDSLPRKLDDARSMLLISPRKPGSAWSAANKERIGRLERSGRLRSPGAAAVEIAKADGSWELLDDVEAMVVPGDLAAALAAHPPAAETFAGLPRSVRRGILQWIKTAKRPDTRTKRIFETARKAQRGERANQFVRKSSD